MSQRIHVLPDHVANQIAAGEVIQRPASVVKELMENAVDAGANAIEVHVLDAGRTSIQVVDDGIGMSPTDARLCFERHATSKLECAEDLFALSTKGFRGEALASIAAIAHVELHTCRQGDDVGVKVRCQGSVIEEEVPKARAQGTTFQVKNLFYNVPARRNFLKSDHVELRHVVDEFQRVALAHPEIAFTLTHQNANLFQVKPGTFRQRIVGILGPKHDERLVPVKESTDVVSIEGFVGKPDSARRSRGEQFLFVNGRFVKHGLIHRAILRSYEGLIAEGQHPLYALHLTVNPGRVDVNIHPTKIEVKFDEEQPLLAIVKSTVKRGLGANNVAPTIDFDAEVSLDIPPPDAKMPLSEPSIHINPTYNPFNSNEGKRGKTLLEAHGGWTPGASSGWQDLYQVLEPEQASNQDMFEGLEIMLWKGTHLLVPTDEGLAVVHVRRAHMRVLYEGFLRVKDHGQRASQALLIPEKVSLTAPEVIALMEAREELGSLGMDIQQVNESTIQVGAIPSDLEGQVRDAIDDLLASYHEGSWDDKEHRREFWAKKWSQRAAIQGSTTMSMDARRKFIAELWACDTPNVDPFGRPAMAMLEASDLEKSFM